MIYIRKSGGHKWKEYERLCKNVLQTYGEFQGQIESCKLQDLLNSTVIGIICSTPIICEAADCILLQTSD